MYKIPKTFNKQKLTGKIVQQISYASNVICIFFETAEYLKIMGGTFVFCQNEQTICCESIYPVKSDLGLLNLLDKAIINTDINDSRDTMTITFDGNITLILKGNDYYESYEVKLNDEYILI